MTIWFSIVLGCVVGAIVWLTSGRAHRGSFMMACLMGGGVCGVLSIVAVSAL